MIFRMPPAGSPCRHCRGDAIGRRRPKRRAPRLGPRVTEARLRPPETRLALLCQAPICSSKVTFRDSQTVYQFVGFRLGSLWYSHWGQRTEEGKGKTEEEDCERNSQ